MYTYSKQRELWMMRRSLSTSYVRPYVAHASPPAKKLDIMGSPLVFFVMNKFSHGRDCTQKPASRGHSLRKLLNNEFFSMEASLNLIMSNAQRINGSCESKSQNYERGSHSKFRPLDQCQIPFAKKPAPLSGPFFRHCGKISFWTADCCVSVGCSPVDCHICICCDL